VKIALSGVSFEKRRWRFAAWILSSWILTLLWSEASLRILVPLHPDPAILRAAIALQWLIIPAALHALLAWWFGLFRRSRLTTGLVVLACILLPRVESFLTLLLVCFGSLTLGMKGYCP
jgi:hypothetical protein